jgi:heavy metal sensor kinase
VSFNLPIRVRLTALYFVVLALTFVAFFWISDIGFRRSIETTVNDASLTNLETVERLLAADGRKTGIELNTELKNLANLWPNGALFEVADARGNWIFRPPRMAQAYPPLPAVNEGRVLFFTTNLDFLQYRIALQRVEAGGTLFEVHAAVPTEPFDQALDHFRLIEQEALPVLVLLASLLGYWLSGRSLAPVNSIIETAQSIGVQNLSRRLQPPKARDELYRLTETLNAMLERMELSFQKITQFTADASHDLRTPLAVIRASAEITLRRQRTDFEYKESLSRILKTCVETSEMLENLLTLARADAGVAGMEMHLLDLGSCVRKAQERAALLSSEKTLSFTAQTPPVPVWVKADAMAIDRLLLILVDNAVKYTPPGGCCQIELSENRGNAQIAVRDTGIGISKVDLERIFERFTRADRARSRETPGAGLGLAIARWITEMHGGTIGAESMLGRGSVFYVRLPASENA